MLAITTAMFNLHAASLTLWLQHNRSRKDTARRLASLTDGHAVRLRWLSVQSVITKDEDLDN